MTSRVLGVGTKIMVMAIIVSIVLLFVGIVLLVLIHVWIVGRAFRRGFDSMVIAERRNGEAGKGLSPIDLEKLPCYAFKAGEKGSGAMDCAVCLESFQLGDRCRLLPVCRHSFHAVCVDSWLLKSPSCPICRSSADGNRKDDQVPEGQQIQAVAVISDPSTIHVIPSG
ncbi:E3 ubiquitin-protein ligase ATL23-like [Typha angustifolia]|uniref:E3 ubiquitin-protein ligase ATL23-like n=1 Tax=Typha angustifolia TaxID=59011 RepID=UPI003C2E26B9